jgi:glutathione peroxidase
MFSKVDVNGAEAHPVFKYLKAKADSYSFNRSVKWNFTKFLVDKSGNVVMRFSPYTKPEELEKDLVKYL